MAKDIISYDFTAGDTGSVLRITVRDKYTKSVIPLNTIYTVNLLFKMEGGMLVSRAMTVLTGADDGKAEYQFSTGELTAGTMQAQIEVTEIASGKKISGLGIQTFEVGPKLT